MRGGRARARLGGYGPTLACPGATTPGARLRPEPRRTERHRQSFARSVADLDTLLQRRRGDRGSGKAGLIRPDQVEVPGSSRSQPAPGSRRRRRSARAGLRRRRPFGQPPARLPGHPSLRARHSRAPHHALGCTWRRRHHRLLSRPDRACAEPLRPPHRAGHALALAAQAAGVARVGTPTLLQAIPLRALTGRPALVGPCY